MAAGSKPNLSIVAEAPLVDSGELEAQPSVEPVSSNAAERAVSRRLVWLLGALLLFVSAFSIAQMQHVRDLEGRMQTLTLELDGARKVVGLHREHLRAVRGEVGAVHAAASELERRVAELSALAGRDPEGLRGTP